MWPFFNPTIKVVTFRLRGWCVLGVFVAGIHPSRTWTSGSFESVWRNACVHRLDLGLYSHPKEFLGGMEFEPMLTPREQSPLPETFPRGGSNPQRCGQRAKTLPTSYSVPPNSKDEIPFTSKILPTGGSNPWRCIKQDSKPNTHHRASPAPKMHVNIKAFFT